MKPILLLAPGALLALSLGGCDERATGSPTEREGYDQRPALEGTLFPSDETSIGDAAIARMLDGRVAIPERVMIAVLPMGGSDAANPGYSGATQAAIAERVEREPRALGVERIPTLVLPPCERGIPRIREACARLQCDLVLIYRVRQEVKVHPRLFAKDEAKSFATVEAVLMDVRTGMVPWTDVVDSEIEAKQDDDHQAWERACVASVQASTKDMAEHLGQFFAKLPRAAEPPKTSGIVRPMDGGG